ncbi:MAG: LacI family DNA-binding transcriptional regulator [Williamsia sp.]|nr:LacI family DNA-binding transcriptional regulator [Williamsia sp.]
MTQVTLQQLAKELNLSIATISKALRDSHEISVSTKKRVFDRARELNFTPNPYAGSLRKKKSRTIAVVLPEVADNFFTLAIKGIQSVAEKKAYHVLIYLSHESYIHEQHILQNCRSGRVDGVLLSISSETREAGHVELLQAHNIPVVFFDRALEGSRTAKIVTNDVEMGYMAARHLLSKKCSRLCFFSLSESLPICKKRELGFKNALAEEGFPEQAVYYCTGDEEKDYQLILELLSSSRPPDGIIACVERIAIQVYLACQQLQIRIPNQLKMVAFSTLETAPILDPPLTTITQPAFEIGKAAAELLFKGIEKTNFNLENNTVVLPSILIERASTKVVSV